MKVKNKAAKSKKEQGQPAKTGSLGTGDAYAYAVGKVLEGETVKSSSSKDEWLGVKKETLNPNDYVDRTQLKTK